MYWTNHFGAKCEANAKITLRSHQPQLVSRNFSFGAEGRTFKNGMKMKASLGCTTLSLEPSWTIIWAWMGNQLPIHDPILFSLPLGTLDFLPLRKSKLLLHQREWFVRYKIHWVFKVKSTKSRVVKQQEKSSWFMSYFFSLWTLRLMTSLTSLEQFFSQHSFLNENNQSFSHSIFS